MAEAPLTIKVDTDAVAAKVKDWIENEFATQIYDVGRAAVDVAKALGEARAEGYRAGREDAAEAVWAKSQVLRGEPFRSGQVGIEYVNGMEDATEIARGGQA